jgi:hypothetical protein
MSTSSNIHPHSEAEAWKYSEKAMSWYGWGSPIGISVFLVAIGAFLLLIHFAGILR